ncbi:MULTISPECIES: DUF1772 domain-containing protein [unclassified Streptomyces]|uniref:anthrone oxygenase family protein n=1 Tax=unclassified Streptomyces TaxID=2593676 RepID=UPI003804F96C
MATLLLAPAVVCTGLCAGFMLVFLTGVMPVLARLTGDGFVTAMRRINEYVPRAVFLTVLLGVIAFPAAAFPVPVAGRTDAQTWCVLAGLACAVLNHLVALGGNIPLDNTLARDPGGDPSAARAAFENRWNGFHRARTVLITAAFGLFTAAAVLRSPPETSVPSLPEPYRGVCLWREVAGRHPSAPREGPPKAYPRVRKQTFATGRLSAAGGNLTRPKTDKEGGSPRYPGR